MEKKKIKAIFFDLDGTLLPMDERFDYMYFDLLCKRLAPRGYEPEKLVKSVWVGTKAMMKNDGSKTNEEVFWDVFAEIYGDAARADEEHFREFYEEDFDKIQSICGFDVKAKEVVSRLKAEGYKLVLATSPIFPRIATEKRIRWAGLKPEDFEIVTTYENSNFCKSNPKYFLNICEKLNVSPEECLMVGNDVADDMAAKEIGMQVFLVTDCLLNRENKDVSIYPQGNFEELIKFIKNC